jgi:hypothetical protein
MARRGRFTNPNSGGQNLTALITALLRERNDAEEQALLNAYRTGTAYNGAVPTADDIQAFYDNWASSSGYASGSLEYQAIVQKKSELNNYDIKKQYNSLLNAFNNNNGANYDELLEFLDNRAVDSTDPQDLESYASAVSDINKSYIGYQGEALSRGEITAAEYRNLTNDIVSQMDPSDPKRYETLVNSYTYEWNAEKSKWDNRLTAGTVTAGQYSNWAKGFQNALLAAGIKKDSVLYTTAVAAQAVVQNRGGGGSSVADKRISENTGKLAKAYLIAAAATGVGDLKDLEDLEKNPSKVNEYIADNPEIWLVYDEYLIQNPGATNLLSGAGIDVSSPEDFANWRESTMDRVQSDYAISGNQSGYDEATKAIKSTGRGSVEDDFAYAASKRNQMLKDATNPIDQTYIRDQWRTYLNGDTSKVFGKIPGGSPQAFALAISRSSQYLVTLYQNEINKANGVKVPDGSITLSGKYDENTGDLNIDNDWQYDGPSQADASELAAGLGVWNSSSQEVVAPSSGGFEDGTYQQVTFAKSLDGSLAPFVREIYGEPLYKTGEAGKETIGWVYDVDGLTIATDTSGKKINLPLSKEANKWVVRGNDVSAATEPNTIGVIDTSVVSTPALLRSVMTRITGDAANGIAGLLTTGNFNDEQKKIITEDLLRVQKAANLRQAAQLQTLPNLSPQQRKQIYELQGVDTSEWDRTVGANLDKYEEVSSGVWKLKPEIAKKQSERGPFSFIDLGPGVGAGINALNVQNLPDTIDIRTTEMKNNESNANILTTIIGLGQGLLSPLSPFGGSTKPSPVKKETPGSVFFRNMNQFRAGEREQLDMRTPKALPVKVFTPQEVNKSLLDFRAGERAPLNINAEPAFTPEEIQGSFNNFRSGERNMK